MFEYSCIFYLFFLFLKKNEKFDNVNGWLIIICFFVKFSEYINYDWNIDLGVDLIVIYGYGVYFVFKGMKVITSLK